MMGVSKNEAKGSDPGGRTLQDDLIKLYAERSQLEGFAHSQDDENQEAFEQIFHILKQMTTTFH